MFDLDRYRIDVTCPSCKFENSVSFRQVRLEERIICCGCHKYIQLIDESKGTERAQRRIRSIDEDITGILEEW